MNLSVCSAFEIDEVDENADIDKDHFILIYNHEN